MIVENEITHAGAAPTIRTWQATNPVTHALLTAVLTTILSYQLTGVIFDLCLGLKAAGSVTVRSLFTQLLVDESSPLAVAAALFRSPTLAKWYFHGFREVCPNHIAVRDCRPNRFPAIMPKVLLLLLVAPIANVISVALSLEHVRVVTFKEASFGGVEIGVRPLEKDGLSMQILMPGCIRYNQRLGRTETPSSQFLLCSNTEFRVSENQASTIRVTVDTAGQIKLTISAPGFTVEQSVTMELAVDSFVYRLKSGITEQQAKSILQTGQDSLGTKCGGTVTDVAPDPILELGEDEWSVTQQVRCYNGISEYDAKFGVYEMAERLTLVETDLLQLLSLDDLKAGIIRYFDGGSIRYFNRHETYVSFALLAFLAIGVTILRVLVKMLTNSDIHMATETIVKDRLQLPCCDSMLQSKIKVMYRQTLGTGFGDLSRKEKYEHDMGQYYVLKQLVSG